MKPHGDYKLSRAPARALKPHNARSWKLIVELLESRGHASFDRLTRAVDGHKHFGKESGHPERFVKYCIRQGWLQSVR